MQTGKMSAHSSEHPIPAERRRPAKLSDALARAIPGRPDMKVAVASVLRERRSRAHGASQSLAKQDDGEAEVIALLYGDASRRKRSLDTQPSHIRPAKAMPVSPGPGARSARAGAANDAQ
jgi:hypothetical protein